MNDVYCNGNFLKETFKMQLNVFEICSLTSDVSLYSIYIRLLCQDFKYRSIVEFWGRHIYALWPYIDNIVDIVYSFIENC